MEIDKKLYNQIKEYCDLNGLKPKEYIHSLLSKAFMEDKYGERPGVAVRRQDEKEIEKIEESFSEIIKNVGGPDTYNDVVTDLIFDNNVAKKDEICDKTSQEEQKKEEKPKKRKIQAK